MVLETAIKFPSHEQTLIKIMVLGWLANWGKFFRGEQGEGGGFNMGMNIIAAEGTINP